MHVCAGMFADKRIFKSTLWRANWIHGAQHLRHRQKHHSYGLLSAVNCATSLQMSLNM